MLPVPPGHGMVFAREGMIKRLFDADAFRSPSACYLPQHLDECGAGRMQRRVLFMGASQLSTRMLNGVPSSNAVVLCAVFSNAGSVFSPRGGFFLTSRGRPRLVLKARLKPGAAVVRGAERRCGSCVSQPSYKADYWLFSACFEVGLPPRGLKARK